MGYYVKNRRVGYGNAAIALPAGDASERPTSPVFGHLRFNTTIGKVEYFDGTIWGTLSKQGNTNIIVDSFTGDSSTTAFGPMTESVSNADLILVFVGSIYQIPTTNYTVAGTTITFVSEAPPATVPVNIIHNLGSTEVA
jgi:hypothetical protein